LDKCGNKLSLRSFSQGAGELDYKLYQSLDFVYFYDGGYQMTAEQNTTGDISILEFHPGYIATEKWTWKGIDQVWIKSYYKLN
jgi:hypothetical protein